MLLMAMDPASAAQEPSSDNGELILKQVTLFNNGVGYFQLGGRVMAGEKIHLRVKAGQMNDLLKSLTVVEQGHLFEDQLSIV